MTRKLAALAIVALIAGCGGEAPEHNGAQTTAQPDKGLRFSACMRENGVPAFPDPDASGELTIDGVLNGSSLDAESPAWKRAIAACKDLQPSGFTGGRRSTAQQDEALEFAQCMRESGVQDFPDPVNGEPLVDTRKIPSAATNAGMATLNAAMQTCGDLVPDQVRDR